LDRLRRLFVWRDQIASGLLAVLILTVAVHQFLTSAGGVLSPWKGGGFGMYTTPHAELSRATFLIIDGRAVRLSPADPAYAAWVAEGDPAAEAYMDRLQVVSERMRSYPRAAAANELLSLASKVIWDGDLFGTWGDIGPAPVSDMAVAVVEIARRPMAGVIETRLVFQFGGE
jgi:hypothetical protein